MDSSDQSLKVDDADKIVPGARLRETLSRQSASQFSGTNSSVVIGNIINSASQAKSVREIRRVYSDLDVKLPPPPPPPLSPKPPISPKNSSLVSALRRKFSDKGQLSTLEDVHGPRRWMEIPTITRQRTGQKQGVQNIRCVLVGGSGVGKTETLARWMTNQFPAELPAVCSVTVRIDSTLVTVGLFEFEGIDKLRTLTKNDVCVLTFGVCSPQSLEELLCKWAPLVQHHAPEVPLVLYGSMFDLSGGDEYIPYANAKESARAMAASAVVYASAKTGQNMTLLFDVAVSCAWNRDLDSMFVMGDMSSKESIQPLESGRVINMGQIRKSPRSPGLPPERLELDWMASPRQAYPNKDWARYGSAVFVARGCLTIVGGINAQGNCVADMLRFDLSSRSWTPKAHFKGRTVPRYPLGGFCSAITIPERRSVLVFGGKGNGYSNALWSCDTSTMEWSLCSLLGAPSARYGHSAIYDAPRSRMVIFGGYASDFGACDDVRLLDVSSLQWVSPSSGSSTWARADPPSPRYWHVAFVCHQCPALPTSCMLVFGGLLSSGIATNELHCFDLVSLTWVSLHTSGVSPPARYGMSGFLHVNSLFLFGGYDKASSTTLSDLWCLSLVTLEWKRVFFRGTASLAARSFHSFCLEGSRLFLLCGRNSDQELCQEIEEFNLESSSLQNPQLALKTSNNLDHQVWLLVVSWLLPASLLALKASCSTLNALGQGKLSPLQLATAIADAIKREDGVVKGTLKEEFRGRPSLTAAALVIAALRYRDDSPTCLSSPSSSPVLTAYFSARNQETLPRFSDRMLLSDWFWTLVEDHMAYLIWDLLELFALRQPIYLPAARFHVSTVYFRLCIHCIRILQNPSNLHVSRSHFRAAHIICLRLGCKLPFTSTECAQVTQELRTLHFCVVSHLSSTWTKLESSHRDDWMELLYLVTPF